MAPKKQTTSRSQDRCACEGGSLDRLIQPAVLAALAREPLHGYAVVLRLSEMPTFKGQTPDTSGVYRVLNWLESHGMVTSSWDTSSSGPAKKTYHITDKGRLCLRTWVKTLRGYSRAIEELLKVTSEADARWDR